MNPTTEMYAKNYKVKEIHQDANSSYIMAIDGIFPIPLFTLVLKLNIVGNKMVLKILFINHIYS